MFIDKLIFEASRACRAKATHIHGKIVGISNPFHAMTNCMGSCASCTGINAFYLKCIGHIIFIQLGDTSNGFTRNSGTATNLDGQTVVSKWNFETKLSNIIGNDTIVGQSEFGKPDADFFDFFVLFSTEKHMAQSTCSFIACWHKRHKN